MRILRLVSCLAVLAIPARAQELAAVMEGLRPPVLLVRPDPAQPSKPLATRAARIRVDLHGALVRAEMDLTFGNDLDRVMEGQLALALPHGATVTAFALEVEGKLREASVVGREKARVVFEAVERQGIDPGLIEWVQGNVFQARVYPIPAHGTKRCVITYEWEAADSFIVPLRMGRLDSLVLEIEARGVIPEVAGWADGKRVDLPEDLDVAVNAEGQIFRASAEGKGIEPAWDLLLTLPPLASPRVALEAGKDGTAFSAVLPVGEASASEAKPGRIALFWDASASRVGVEPERALLAKYLAWLGEVQVHLVVFSDAVWFEEDYAVSEGKADELFARIEGLTPDGGTRLGALDFAALDEGVDAVVLCTDGMTTFGQGLPSAGTRPVHVLCSQGKADHAVLSRLATGHLFDLSTTGVEACLEAWKTEPVLFLGVEGEGISEVLPPAPSRAGAVLALSGRIAAEGPVEAKANFRDGAGKTWSVPFTVDTATAREGEGTWRAWARKRVASLVPAAAHEAEVQAIGMRYGIVTPATSLLVLDTLEQYVRYHVVPPAEWQEAYFEKVELEKRAMDDARTQKLAQVRAMWTHRVEWWKKDFEVPPGYKAPGGESKGDDAGVGAGFADSEAPGSRAPQEEARGLEDSSDHNESADGPSKNGKDAENGSSGPGIVLKPWTPDTPYLKALREAGDGAYAAYGRMRAEYGNSSAFFLDVADFFAEERKDRATALRVLSSVAEMDLGSPQLLRILAHRLDQMGELPLAEEIFREVLRLRPEEPQSYRDLALVLAKKEAYAEAISLLEAVILGTWDGRFPEIELIALGELNRIVETSREKTGKDAHTLPDDLIAAMPMDLRIILTWDADNCDMDLWVVEPSGEKAFYGHTETVSGGHFGRDFTGGYGPEEYLVKKGMPGKFALKINYYGNRQQVLAGATTVQIVVFKNYGRPNEERIAVTRRLGGVQEVLDIAEVNFP